MNARDQVTDCAACLDFLDRFPGLAHLIEPAYGFMAQTADGRRLCDSCWNRYADRRRRDRATR